MGFVPTRHAGDNTGRTIHLIDLLNKFPRPALILILGSKKAFVRLSWPYMFSTLTQYGPFLMHWKHYTGIPQLRSSFLLLLFPMMNGTQKSCRLSPLLFILCLEPLAEAIQSNPNICEVLMRQRECILSLFADDIVNPH